MQNAFTAKKTISSLQSGYLYSFVHFSVEVACFYFLFSRFSTSPLWWGAALLYDALAFVSQGVIGIIADKYAKFAYSVSGLLLILISLLLPFDYPALFLIGIGNALVHIGGAQQTLKTGGGKIAPTGIFVGGGSFGVILGQLLGAQHKDLLLLIPILLILFSAAAVLFVSRKYETQEKKWCVDITSKRSTVLIAVFAVIVTAIRAYIGYAIPTEWKKTDLQAVALFVIMGMGKIAGGLAADAIGYRKTVIISALALPFLLFGNANMWLSLIGVGLFSMTMPITISILVSRFPDLPCFSFGLTTIALFLGSAPAFFIRPESLLAHQITVLILTVIATALLIFCIEKRK